MGTTADFESRLLNRESSVPLTLLNDTAGKPTGWLADIPVTHPGLPALQRQLPAVAPAGPAILILPLVLESAPVIEFWRVFPARLAVLLTVVPRDAVFACNKAAVEQFGGFHDGNSPAWEWLIRAVFGGTSITVLPPHEISATADWNKRLPVLAPSAPGPERDWLWKPLQDTPAKSVVPARSDSTTVIALQAGIYQWHDYLDESHECSQQIEGEGPQQLGDYWHGIMHRREPDDTNAKYWFRRIGKQPIFPQVAQAADKILRKYSGEPAERWRGRLTAGGKWDPFAFIDFCSACRSRPDELTDAAKQIQFAEMSLLLAATFAALAK